MGYSCSSLAMSTMEQLMIQLKAAGKPLESSNSWEKNGVVYFHEVGREQRDGAVTGTIQKTYQVGDNNYCKCVGTFRFEPDGTVKRFPTSTKSQREVAQIVAKAENERRKSQSFGW